jgi:phosphatidylethanolamine-binding protein (PEBP) family uncharacterized protein
MYEVTAAFTHWGMYSISPQTTSLPENAGLAGGTYGIQIFNDFFAGAEYDGPCPPATLAPLQHHYVITVYALDVEFKLAVLGKLPRSRGDVVPSIARGRPKSTRPGKRQYRRVLFVGSI